MAAGDEGDFRLQTCPERNYTFSDVMGSDDADGTNGTNGDDVIRMYCPDKADPLLCWPRTPAGKMVILSCPSEMGGFPITPFANASRYCQPNGSWHAKADYSQCEPMDDALESNDDVSATRIIYYVGFVLSTIALIVALAIFVSFRSLRCLRNTIHCHLIVAFILKNLLWLMMYSVLPILSDYLHLTFCEYLCRGIVSLFNYVQVASFFWMLVEGLYLHSIIVCAFGATSLRIWYFAVIGWGTPLVFISIWAVVRATVEQTEDEAEVSVKCWLPSNISPYDYIFITPILAILLTNMVFLAAIVYVLVSKLQEPHSMQTVQYRKAVRATFVLLPLLGIIYVLFITNPSEDRVSRHVFSYFNSALQSTQGLLVAVFYCFLNGEVRTVIGSRFASWSANRQLQDNARYSLAHQPPPHPTIVLSTDPNGKQNLKDAATTVRLKSDISSEPQDSTLNQNLV